ncbi:glycoside hydrolase family 2 TIM barrel-domain containing protein [Arcanobacterium canis]
MSTLALTLTAFGPLPHAAAETDYSALTTSNQMASTPEDVYTAALDAHTRVHNFNDGWKFKLGANDGAQSKSFSDANWRSLDLPHDYSIEQDFTKNGEAESGYLPGGVGWYRKNLPLSDDFAGKRINLNFDGVYMDATVYVNGQKVANHPYGYTPFSVDITDYVEIGATNVIAVKVNHETPSSRWYSGSGIYRNVDLVVTNPVHVGHDGVRVVAPNLKSGGDVPLEVTARLENESSKPVTVKVSHEITTLDGKNVLGKSEAKTVQLKAGERFDNKEKFTAKGVKLWDLETPTRYRVTTTVADADGVVLDKTSVTTGFRTTAFDPKTGFSLNGKKMKLKGVSMHHDQGALGARAYRAAIARQIRILKEMGVNAIRVTHNPASRDLIDLADEMGVLIVEESFDGFQRAKNNNRNDYARFFNEPVKDNPGLENVPEGSTWAQFDLESMIHRSMNSPSVIMWSIGNEIGEGTAGYENLSNYTTSQANLIKWAKAADPTRPVTRGDNQMRENWNSATSDLMRSLVDAGGIAGVNYVAGDQYRKIHEAFPKWPLYGSETASSVNSRGVYDRTHDKGKTSDKRLTSYDNSAVGWGARASAAWYDVITRDYVAGEFVWTGFDYIGEPTHWNGIDRYNPSQQGTWPAPKNSYFGIVDTAGFPKDSYYLYQSQWNDKAKTVHILPAWNGDVLNKKPGEKVKVDVYSNAAAVELYFTPAKGGEKKKVGEKQTFETKKTPENYTYQLVKGKPEHHESLYMTWEVPFEEGKLEAVGYDSNGQKLTKTLGRSVVETAGKPAKLDVHVDRKEIAADGSDLAYVEVTVTDDKGVPVPSAKDMVTFEVTGDGVFMGSDNGEQADHTRYDSKSRKAFAGKVLGIVKSTKKAGSFTVKATAPTLATGSVTVTTKAAGVAASDTKAVDHYKFPRTVYVKTGNKPLLPATIDAYNTAGKATSSKVTWGEIPPTKYAKAGDFTVAGKTDAGDTVSVYVVVIDGVGAVLNYSDTTPVGTPVVLPEQRPVVMPDGKILDATFPVTWEKPEATKWNAPGTVSVKGTAEIFGKKYPVTATIRVQEALTKVGKNVASAASLSQSIPQGLQTDTLKAITDGETTVPSHDGGTNPHVWSNYNYTQKERKDTASIVFEYATAQSLGEFEVWFYKDGWSARYPKADTTKFFVKDSDGEEWKPVKVKETIGKEQGNVRPYTYTLDQPVQATYVKLEVTNNPDEKTGNKDKNQEVKPVTGISEVLLKGVEKSFPKNSTVALDKVTLNGKDLPAETLKAWKFESPEASAKSLEATAPDNAAVTILPQYKAVSRVIVEAEDHSAQKIFEITFAGAPHAEQPPAVPAPDPNPTAPAPQPEPTAPAPQPEPTAPSTPTDTVTPPVEETTPPTQPDPTASEKASVPWTELTPALKKAKGTDTLSTGTPTQTGQPKKSDVPETSSGLARTGATVAGLGIATVVLAGAGVILLARKNKRS